MKTVRPYRPRQADVAAAAGVSVAIVSQVINGRTDGNIRVSEETRERVWSAVRELGYVPNPIARSLAGGQNRLLGVFTYEAVFPLAQQSFYLPFLFGIEEAAAALDYNLLLFTRSAGAQGRRTIFVDGVNSLQLADGAILLGRDDNRQELERLLDARFPFVFVGRRELPGRVVPHVAAGYVDATVTVVNHLVQLGHQRIAYLRMPETNEPDSDREHGFRLAFTQLGLPLDESLIQRCTAAEVTPERIRDLAERGVSAIVTQTAAQAKAVQAACRALNISIPQDCSLAVLGDPLDPSEDLGDATMFHIPRREMGEQAVHLLARMLTEGTEPQSLTLACMFVPGNTTAPRIH